MPNFSAPISGQSLTKAPGSTPWQKAPKYAKLSDACNFIFNQITDEPKLHQLLAMMKRGVTLEALARVIIFSGFSTGLWTPDMALLMGQPTIFMLAGIAKRAGLNPRLTHVDRSGLKDLVHMKHLQMTANPESLDQNNSKISKPLSKPQGLLSPIGVQ